MIGSNITALREFTALCKVDSIPLKKYLLGNHLKKDGSRSPDQKKPRKHENLVDEMGGVDALGKVSELATSVDISQGYSFTCLICFH